MCSVDVNVKLNNDLYDRNAADYCFQLKDCCLICGVIQPRTMQRQFKAQTSKKLIDVFRGTAGKLSLAINYHLRKEKQLSYFSRYSQNCILIVCPGKYFAKEQKNTVWPSRCVNFVAVF